MADVKISGLPASTTPLAGTEVLPVVQGGATKQVSVANLTAGRAVSAASLALTGSALPVGSGGSGTGTAFTAGSVVFAGASGVYSQDNANLFWDDTNNRLGVNTNAPQGKFQVLNSGSLSSDTDSNAGSIIAGENLSATSSQANLFIYSNSTATDGFGGSIALGGLYTGNSVAAFGRIAGVRNGGSYWGDLTFSTRNPSGSMVEAMRISSAQGVSIGNTTDPGAANLSVTGTVRTGGYTVATLPAAGAAGRRAYVTDATLPTYLGVLVGGGAVVCPVFDNGTAWVSA
jgi:hypothetical protein